MCGPFHTDRRDSQRGCEIAVDLEAYSQKLHRQKVGDNSLAQTDEELPIHILHGVCVLFVPPAICSAFPSHWPLALVEEERPNFAVED